MIISTSSQNVQLTEEICEYVEDVLRKEFRSSAEHVASIDARLDIVHGSDPKMVVRVDLCDQQVLVTESSGNSLYAAIRRGAADSAHAVDGHLPRSRQVNERGPSRKYLAFGRYSAANI